MSNSQRTFRLTEIEVADLGALDLRAEAEEITDGHAYLITIYDDTGIHPEAETAQALFSLEEGYIWSPGVEECGNEDARYGRLGIAWGADATWADGVESLETGVEMWLNNPEEWEAMIFARTYLIAEVLGTGDWGIIEEFRAQDDTAANAYAEEHYGHIEWYVLNEHQDNING
jgi:hypothetical protein